MTVAMNTIKKINSENLIFFFIALTFFFLPVRTAVPLISISCATAIYFFSKERLKFLYIVRKRWFYPVLLFVLLPWIGLLYSKNLDLGLTYALKTKYWIAVFIMASLTYSNKRFSFLLKSFWLSLLIGSVLAFFQYMELMETLGTDFLGFGLVYTVLSMYLIIGILNASYYFKSTNCWKKRIAIILLIIAFVFHLSVLAGRNGYLVLLVVSPLIINNLTYKRHFAIKVIVFSLLIGGLSLSPIVQNRIAETIGQLKKTEVIEKGEIDELLIRPYIYHSTLYLIANHPVWGIGTGSLKYYTEKKGHGVTHPHNNILYMAVSFGVAGIVSFFWLFGTMLIVSWKNRHTPAGFMAFSICIVIFLGGMFDTLIINSGTNLLLPMGYGLLNHLDPPQRLCA